MTKYEKDNLNLLALITGALAGLLSDSSDPENKEIAEITFKSIPKIMVAAGLKQQKWGD